MLSPGSVLRAALLLSLDWWVSADDLGLGELMLADLQNNKLHDERDVRRCDSPHIKPDCELGSYRESSGPYEGLCVPCSCNGLSAECHPQTGRCLKCQFNSAGDHCERCREGHYGSALLRTCQMCPCPLTHPSNSFAVGCVRRGDEIECLCKSGYTGVRCERCAPGYFGDPLSERGGCQPCDCDQGYVCDPLTGGCHEESPDSGQCSECDVCVLKLLYDLYAMDAELLTLKTHLKDFLPSSSTLTRLRNLQDSIAATKVWLLKYTESILALKPKIRELESDIETLKDDLYLLNDKAIQTSCIAAQLLKTLDQTYQRGDNLRSGSVDLLRKIQEFLDQIKRWNPSSGNTVEATEMLNQARWMLEHLRRLSCRIPKSLAKEELRKARALHHLTLMNLTNGAFFAFGHIGQKLMNSTADLRDVQEALVDAELEVLKANAVNKLNKDELKDAQKHLKRLKEEQGTISAKLTMIRRALEDLLEIRNMIDDLTKEIARLAAETDGAKTSLDAKLDQLSRASTKQEVVRRAEEHAEELMKLAVDFQKTVTSITNSSAFHEAAEVIRTFASVTRAITEAEDAAVQARAAAHWAFENVQGEDLKGKAENLKDLGDSLLKKARNAAVELQDVTQKLEASSDKIQQAGNKHNQLTNNMSNVSGKLNDIKRDEIPNLINQTKQTAREVNTTATEALTRLQNISEDLNKTRLSSDHLSLATILDDVNKTLTELDDTFPSLVDKLKEVENCSENLPVPTNMSNSIQRIKDLIEKSRDLANRIRGPILFSGDAHVELRPPKDLEDLRVFTAFNLTLHRPKDETRGDGKRRRQLKDEEESLFVLYLGNKITIKDYIGLVVRNGILFCIYKLGGIVHEIETIEISKSSNNNSFMDRVDFRRVYQDAQITYTKFFTSSEPVELPPWINQPESMSGLLDLDPSEVVFYVGGYPSDFMPPEELRYPGFQGCIEFSTLNNHILGLYNFKSAANVTKADKCKRGRVRTVGYYLDGTGYGKIEVSSKNSYIKFQLNSHQTDAVLLLMENKDSFFSVTIEAGFVVLRGANDEQMFFNKTELKVFPHENNIQIIMILNEKMIAIDFTEKLLKVFPGYVKGLYEEAYIGGLPDSIRRKYKQTLPPLRGCIDTLQVDRTVKFVEEVGIVQGCLNPLLGVREVEMRSMASLSVPPVMKETDSGTMVSLAFKASHPASSAVVLLNGGLQNTFQLVLDDDFVIMSDNEVALRSRNRCETGEWHYVTARANSSGIHLNVDNTEGVVSVSVPRLGGAGETLRLGGGLFQGCLRNLYMRSLQNDYIPSDFSGFNQTGTVFLGFCRTVARNRKKHARHAELKANLDRSGDLKSTKSVKHSYELDSSSLLQFRMTPEMKRDRLHISLAVRTQSSDGLLLQITDETGVPVVILSLTNGKVQFSVEPEEITCSGTISDGTWHRIKFSMDRGVFRLTVDGVRELDGRLAHGLQSPVFVEGGELDGKDQQSSISGCIRDLRFSKGLSVEPDIRLGVTGCFKGFTEKGAYFGGDGGYVVLENFPVSGWLFNLAFEFRPRHATGLLLQSGGPYERSFAVFLKKGKIVVQVQDGKHHYGTTVTPAQPLVGRFHYLSVFVQPKTIELKVDEMISRVRGPPAFHPPTRETIYIGGISGTSSRDGIVKTSYKGCLRNFRINQTLLPFEKVNTVVGLINTAGCPTH